MQTRQRLAVEVTWAGLWTAGTPAGADKPAVQAAPVDINSASRGALGLLPGIGPAEVERIVAGRPYLSKARLVTGNVIPAGVYQQLRHRIVAIQPHVRPATTAGRPTAGI